MSQMLINGKDSEGTSLTGGRRPTRGDVPSENEKFSAPLKTPNPETMIRAPRRRLTAKYKLEILDAYERCSTPEERGSLLRKEGLYTSQLSNWRKARKSGALSALSKKRGRPKTKTPQEEQIALLKAQNQELLERLAEAEAINDIQKKVSEILGNRIKKPKDNGENS